MSYRGSKSENINPQPNKFSVKEQRVDGSSYISGKGVCLTKPMFLRYTLMGGESNYQIKIPSKQLSISPFSTLINKENLSNSTSNLCGWSLLEL